MEKPGIGEKNIFCFGLGYSAAWLARALIPLGWKISGTCREEEKRRELEKTGIEAFCFTRGQKLSAAGLDALSQATHLLSSISPDDKGDPVLDEHQPEIIDAPALRWIGYLSTTGVYGDRQGDWVDEESPPLPTGERGKRRILAERAWLSLPNPAHIFRLAGIYGPGRSVIENILKGSAQRIVKPGQFFGRIHVEDIAQILLASMEKPNPGRLYNLSDDHPASPGDILDFACALLGRSPLPSIAFEDAALSPMARSFYADNKRVKNDRVKKELGIKLRYPDYRAGLRAIAALIDEEEDR